jgi:hypothetical protein
MKVALITREYVNGRIAITTDRLGGFRTGNGFSLSSFWRTLIRWSGQRSDNENVNVAILKSLETSYENFLSRINGVNYTEINEEYILSIGLDEFDAVYFIGLPKGEISSDFPDAIEEYVNNGGGLIIESPDKNGEIEILSAIDSVNVSSIKRPSHDTAFWTQTGIDSDVYVKEYTNSSFMVEIKDSDFSNDWSILLSDIETVTEELETQDKILEQDYSSRLFQEFSIGFIVGISEGTVYLEEGDETSSSSSSSSSSSGMEEINWELCDNLVANWKLNENNLNSFIWDSSGDFSQIGNLKSSGIDINTSSNSIDGKINNGIVFSKTDQNNIVVPSGTKLNFTDGINDSYFSNTIWVKPYDDTGTQYLLEKSNVWELYLINKQINFKLVNGINSRSISSSSNLIKDQWNFITITYDGLSIAVYINGENATGVQVDSGYSTMSNTLSELYIGSSSSGDWFNGVLDNVVIFDKSLSSSEIEALWNIGLGTEECSGAITYTSSSSSSSSSSSN